MTSLSLHGFYVYTSTKAAKMQAFRPAFDYIQGLANVIKLVVIVINF